MAGPGVSEAIAVEFKALRIFAIAARLEQRDARDLLLLWLLVLHGLVDEVGDDYQGLALLIVEVADEASRLNLKIALGHSCVQI